MRRPPAEDGVFSGSYAPGRRAGGLGAERGRRPLRARRDGAARGRAGAAALRARSRQRGTTAAQPRLSVFRSGRHVYAQLIDDGSGKTLCAMTDKGLTAESAGDGGRKQKLAYSVGKQIAVKAVALGITKVAFDRGGNAYHGRVQAVAEGAREGGLKF